MPMGWKGGLAEQAWSRQMSRVSMERINHRSLLYFCKSNVHHSCQVSESVWGREWSMAEGTQGPERRTWE